MRRRLVSIAIITIKRLRAVIQMDIGVWKWNDHRE